LSAESVTFVFLGRAFLSAAIPAEGSLYAAD
jgi:hypothetical protein